VGNYSVVFEEQNNKNYPGGKAANVFHLVPKLKVLDIVVVLPFPHTPVA
jgi:hypothetical protein